MPETDPRIAFFDRLAPQWDADQPPLDQTRARLDALAPQLGLRPGLDLLEVGCGTGLVTAWLADQVAPGSVTSLDFSPAMIAQAEARGVSATFVCADVCDGGLAGGPFDYIWCMSVFPHFRDQARALRNLATVLAPGGTLLVLHLASWRRINDIHDRVGDVVAEDFLPPPDAWPALLAPAGLTLAEIVDHDDLFCIRAHKN